MLTSNNNIGARFKLNNGDTVDVSNQAHVFIASKRLSPPANTVYDHRPLTEVKRLGLREGYGSLDSMKPLAETIFHEVRHSSPFRSWIADKPFASCS
jgi:hypothetical protein